MAGFYLTTKSLTEDKAKKVFSFLSFSPNAWKTEFRDEKHHCILSRLDREDIWAPAQDDLNNIHVYLSGRIALEQEQWNKEFKKNRRGGLAASHIIEEYSKKELSSINSLNGAFAIVIIDFSRDKIIIVTDKLGFYPVYVYDTGTDLSLSTNTDTLSRLNDQNEELDLISIAEVLKFGYCIHPNTYYKNIKQLDPGSVYEIKSNHLIKVKQYWEPQPLFLEYNSKEALTIELAEAIQSSVRRRTIKELGKTGVFLSAGADSRSILAAADNPSALTSFTFFDVKNNEYNLAEQIAEAYGSQHIGLKRDPEHYGLGAKLAAKVISGHWNITDVHYANFIDELNKFEIENYLSGCFADFLFKGIAYNRTELKLFNKNLPLYKIAPFSQEWYFHISTLKSNYDRLSSERNLSSYSGIELNLENDLTYWKIEKARLFPISREATFGSRQFLFRSLPWDPILADNDLLEMFQKIPPKWKINGDLWKKSVNKLSVRSKNIIDNNNLAPLNYGKIGITFKFLEGVLKRKITGKDVDGTELGKFITRGSWPNFQFYLENSKIIAELWQLKNHEIQELFSSVLGFNPFKIAIRGWAQSDHLLFYRLLTLKLWFEENNTTRN